MPHSYSVILGFMGQLRDRFATYHASRSLDEKLALAASIGGVSGVEMVYPTELDNPGLASELLAGHGLALSAVNVNIKGDPCWQHGALTARDAATRHEAVRWIQAGMDLAAELGSGLVTVCPLADGHDYPFEQDYGQAWRWLIEGLRAAADHRPDVRLSVEYKPSEPRARVIVGSAARTLYACVAADRPNLGVTLDMGHALYAGEACADSVALLAQAERLFLVHGNDNYRNWDWDLVPGTVNLWDLVESSYYLRRVGYNGWVAFDVFPARLDPVRAMRSSLRMYRLADQLIDRIGMERLGEAIAAGDVLETFGLLQAELEEGVSDVA